MAKRGRWGCANHTHFSSHRTTPPWAPSVRDPPPAGEGEVSALVLATHPRPRLADQSHEFCRLKENKGRRSAGRRYCPVGLRHASDVATRMRFRRSRASFGTRSPLGAPPRLWPRFLGLGFSTSGQVSWDAVQAEIIRAFLSQSSGSTPRTGRNAGGHDARSRPGADCVGPRAGTAPAVRYQEHPHDGVPSTSERRA
jgi:hypothetical protein